MHRSRLCHYFPTGDEKYFHDICHEILVDPLAAYFPRWHTRRNEFRSLLKSRTLYDAQLVAPYFLERARFSL